MIVIERQQMILNHLAKNGNVSVAELCQRFSVSEMTIRRDLAELEKQGLLQRTYGGAIPTEPAFFEMSSRAKLSLFTEEKSRIGKICADMVKDGEVIFLDSSTTVLQIARNLKSKSITVVTNDLNIASEMLDGRSVEIYIVGGLLRRGSISTFGPKASGFFDDIRGDKFFMGVEGVDVRAGYTVPDMTEVELKRKMLRSASQVIIAADHSKLGRNSMGVIAPLSAADCLVTDSDAPKAIIEALQEHVQITLA